MNAQATAKEGTFWTLRVVSLAAVALLIGGFGYVADEVIEGSTMRFDSAVTRWFRVGGNLSEIAGPPWFQEAVRDFTSLGSFTLLGVVVIASALYLLFIRRHQDALILVVSVVLGTVLSNSLKFLFNRPRPDVEASSHVFTASFPSGHATLSAVVYLTLGVLLARSTTNTALRVYFVGLAMVLTFLVGMSRIYLGMHYPTDVIAGWCIGVAWATLCWVAVDLIERGERRQAGLLP